MEEFVCCVDMGTSRIKAALFDPAGNMPFITSDDVPKNGVSENLEFDAEAHFQTACALVKKLIAGKDFSRVSAVSITNQRATVVPVDKTGRAAAPAVSWQDTRCEAANGRFIEKFGEDRFRKITGLPRSALWSLAKILRAKENGRNSGREADKYVLLQDYILKRLGAEDFSTDFSNASVTGLLDLRRLEWSVEILDASGLNPGCLPLLKPASTIVGALSREAAVLTGLPEGVPLVLGGGDQQCAALGIGATSPGEAGLCLGTAAVVSCPTDHAVTGGRGGFFCTAHAAPDRWVLEGIHNSYGSSVQWACEMLGASSAGELEALASTKTRDKDGVFFLPFLAGIGSPDYKAGVRAAFFGIDGRHTRADLAAAVLEGIVMETRRILDAMRPHASLRNLHVAGGGASPGPTNRLLADLLGAEVYLHKTAEASLLGACILAWTAVKGCNILETTRICTDRPDQFTAVAPSGTDRTARYMRYCEFVDALRQADTARRP